MVHHRNAEAAINTMRDWRSASPLPSPPHTPRTSDDTPYARRALLLLLAALCGALLVSAPASLQAQEPDQRMGGVLEALEFDKDESLEKPLPASSVDEISLGVYWKLFKRMVGEGQSGANELHALRDGELSAGIPNDPAASLAAIKLITDQHAQGKLPTGEASKGLAAADDVAPSLPHAKLARARFLLRHDPLRAGEIVTDGVQGWRLALAWPDTARVLELNATLYALLALLVLTLVFVLMQTTRYFSVISYDLVRLLPSGFSSAQAVLALLALILVPGVLMQSPLLSLMILLMLVSTVQQPRERLISLLIFATLAALPQIEAMLGERLSWITGSSHTLFEAQYMGCDAACMRRVEQLRSESERDVVLDYTEHLLRYRSGALNTILSGDDALSTSAIEAWPTRLRGYGYTLRGAALVATQKPEQAAPLFEQASTLLPDEAAPQLNLMRTAQMRGDKEQARRSLEEANRRDLHTTLEFIGLERRDVNSTLRVPPLPPEIFWQRHRAADTQPVELLARVWPLLAGGHLPFSASTFIGLIGMALSLLTLPLVLRHKSSTPCPSCGLARDPDDGITTHDHPYCASCYGAFIMGSTLSYSERVQSDEMLHSRRSFQQRARRFSSLLMPGAGHMMAGYAVRGALLCFGASFGALWLLRPQGVWRAPDDIIYGNWLRLDLLGGLLLGVALLIALYLIKVGLEPIPLSTATHPPQADDAQPARGGRR